MEERAALSFRGRRFSELRSGETMFRFVGVLALVGGVLADPTKTMFGDDRTQDSFGRSQLEPPCSKIECILCANGESGSISDRI